jgi:hypothetical protein
MAARKNRDQLVIATKYTTEHRAWELGKGPQTVNYNGNSKKSLRVSVAGSLKKLGTDYIDLLYVHWWDWTSSIEEVMDSLHILVEQGKVLYLGISDTPAWIVSAANVYARAHGKTQFSVYQGRWNIMQRDFERDISRFITFSIFQFPLEDGLTPVSSSNGPSLRYGTSTLGCTRRWQVPVQEGNGSTHETRRRTTIFHGCRTDRRREENK